MPMAEPLDLIWGAAAIAALLGRTTKATLHMLERGQIPARKVGARWCANRKALREFFEGREDAA